MAISPEAAPTPKPTNESQYSFTEESFLSVQAQVLDSFFTTLSADERALYFASENTTIEEWLLDEKNTTASREVVTGYLAEGGDPEKVDVMVEALKERLQAMIELH